MRNQTPLCWIAVTGLMALAVGCSSEPAGNYKTYEQSQARSDDASTTSSDESPSAAEVPQSENATTADRPAEEQVAAADVAPASEEAVNQQPTGKADEPSEESQPPATADVPQSTAEDAGGDSAAQVASTVEPAGDTSQAEKAEASADRPEQQAASDDTELTEAELAQVEQVLKPAQGLSPEDQLARATAEDLAPGADPSSERAGLTKPRKIKLLVPDRTFKVEGPDGAIRVSYDDLDLLKVLNMQPVPEDAVKHFPDWLAGLDGQRIRIRGFMYPTFEASGLRGFILARDNEICCFGRNPLIYDLIPVQLADGVTTDYIANRPFDVVGDFHIDPDYEDGEWWQLYRMDNARVIQ